MLKNECEDCFKIICKGCGWEPNSLEEALIQEGKITSCPDCGWNPGESTISTPGC